MNFPSEHDHFYEPPSSKTTDALVPNFTENENPFALAQKFNSVNPKQMHQLEQALGNISMHDQINSAKTSKRKAARGRNRSGNRNDKSKRKQSLLGTPADSKTRE